MKKKSIIVLFLVISVFALLMMSACGAAPAEQVASTEQAAPAEQVASTEQATSAEQEALIPYRFASQAEGKELLLANKEYYDCFSQNDLDFRMQKKNATMEEYLPYAGEQVLDFTDEEKTLIDSYLSKMSNTLKENGYVLPPLEEIIFVKTTMKEESGAGGYTHGTQIYIRSEIFDAVLNGDEETSARGCLFGPLFLA